MKLFEIHYPVLPGSILTRLIVRTHRHVQDRVVWRTGVLLERDGNEALVRAELAANRVIIAVRGPGPGRRDLLSRVRTHLSDIHATIADLRPKEKVPIPGHPEVEAVDYKHLCTLEYLGEETFIPPGLMQRVSVRQLLDGVESPQARRVREARDGDTYNIYGGQIGVIGDKANIEGGINSS